MRNLKRALSLALATVMTLGLMVVGTGAVGYTDVTSEDNQEAIEVLQAVGIMTGVTDDEFDPDGLVTRNQIAVIMSNLLNLDYNYYRGINPFTDVPSWAAPYVAACAAEGVVAGIGGGLYGGENNVTAAQAALMLMKALGYFQYQGDFTPDWQVATIRQGSYIGLFKGVDSSAEAALTRGQVAQMVLNALKSDMVYFTGDVGATVGDVVINYRPEYTPRTSADNQYGTLIGNTTELKGEGQYIIQLGEELYDGDLREMGSEDAFNRPATTWRYDGSNIGTYTDEPDLTYTTEVKMGDIYKDLGLAKSLVVDAVDVYEDGASATSYGIVKGDSDNKLGGNGVLTEVFYDADNETAIISQINTYLGEVTSTHKATSTKDAYIAISPKVDGIVPGGNYETDDAYGVEELVTFTYSYKSGDKGVQSVASAEDLVTGELNGYTENKRVEVNGEPISVNAKNKGIINENDLINAVDQDVTVYLDDYGYALWIDTTAISGNYAVVIDKQGGTSFMDDEVKLLMADGTVARGNVASFTTNSLDADFDNLKVGDIVTYTTNSSGDYKLTTVANRKTVDNDDVVIVKNGDSALNSDAGNYLVANDYTVRATRANGKTLFLIATKVNNSTVYSVYEGIANVPTVETTGASAGVTVTTYVKDVVNGSPKTGSARVVYIDATGTKVSVTGDSKDVIFVMGGSDNATYSTALGGYWEYDAIINGEFGKIRSDAPVDGLAMFGKVSYDTNDIASLDNGKYFDETANAFATTGAPATSGVYAGTGTDRQASGVLYLAGNYVTFSDDCKVFRVDADGDLEESEFTASTVAKDTNDRVWYHEDAGTGDVDYIVIETVEEGEAPVYNVNLTGVTLADKGNSDGKVDIRLQGTGSLANGWSVYFELIKTSKVDDDAVVDTGTFNEGGSGTVLTGYGFDSDSAGVTASETGTYKVRVTVKNADGETVATATSAESVRVTVGP